MTKARVSPFLRGLIWATGCVAAGVYVVIAWIILTDVRPGADGLWPLDLRVLGYDGPSVATYVGALTQEAKATLMGQMRWLDTVFPIALTLFLGLLVWASSRHPGVRLMLLVPPVGYGVIDLFENVLVAELLGMPTAALTSDTVRLASEFTVTKFVLLGGALAAVLVSRRGARRLAEDVPQE